MKAVIRLIPPMDEQRRMPGYDGTVIDPEGVDISRVSEIVFADGQYNLPRDVAGRLVRAWKENGSVMVEVDLFDVDLGYAALNHPDRPHELVAIHWSRRPRTPA